MPREVRERTRCSPQLMVRTAPSPGPQFTLMRTSFRSLVDPHLFGNETLSVHSEVGLSRSTLCQPIYAPSHESGDALLFVVTTCRRGSTAGFTKAGASGVRTMPGIPRATILTCMLGCQLCAIACVLVADSSGRLARPLSRSLVDESFPIWC